MRSGTIVATFVFVVLGANCSIAQRKVPVGELALPLRLVVDVPLTGNASRLDYQSFDPESGRLYISHLADDMVTVFDVKTQKIVGDIKDLRRVHGVIVVPELHRVYASATGTNELAVIDDQTLQVIAGVPAGDYPDGIAFASKEKKIYVSDLRGKTDTVIDAVTNKRIATIALNAPAGNSQYDAASDRIFVAVRKLNSIIEIDPTTDKIVGPTRLPDVRMRTDS